VNEVESILKEIKDKLKINGTIEKEKQIQSLLLEKQKHDKQNREYFRLKQKEEEENKLKLKLKQDKKNIKMHI
jgi:5-formaminoimidazole-4-carboxamide-1-beta-D-ribofuranosyl 5'-monophosphate synthetase